MIGGGVGIGRQRTGGPMSRPVVFALIVVPPLPVRVLKEDVPGLTRCQCPEQHRPVGFSSALAAWRSGEA